MRQKSPRSRWSSNFNGKTDFYQRSLGKHFLDYESEVILSVGNRHWTRTELATELGCCHLAAARRLGHNLELHGIDSINKLHATPPEELAAMAGVGTIQIFVVMCVLDVCKFDSERLYKPDVTTSTLQARAKKKQQARS